MGDILQINNLSISLKQRNIVEGISFSINKGDAVLLSGENGIGKSTILKTIMGLETADRKVNGEILYCDYGNILNLDIEKLQKFRSEIAYVQQKDEYTDMGNIQVRDIISECSESYSGKSLNYSEVNDLIDEWIPRKDNNKRVFDSKSKPGKFSGGEQRLLSVLSVIATRSGAKLFIIDEPLNNLDFINARNISNIINKVVRDNSEMGLLMISHCRIFPFINREIKLTYDGIVELDGSYTCHSCFGEPNKEGFYGDK